MKISLKDTINNILISKSERELEFAVNDLKSLSNHRDSQIKFYGENDTFYLLKISPLGPQEFKIDYPIKLNKVHKQCYATKEQCIAIIKELYEVGHIDNIPGFLEVPIGDFTLDDMIEFKKEEEMMLKGEDPFKEEENLNTNTEIPEEKKEIIKQPEIKTKKQKKESIKKEPVKTVKKNKESDNYFQI